MKRACILGHFAYGKNVANGQTIKTKILTNELARQFGEKEIKTIDTCGGIKSLIKAPFHVFFALKQSQNVVMLPAHNGVRIYGRLLPWLRPFFRDRKIHYSVIGGWLPKMLKTKKGLAGALKKFDGIYVETETMKRALEAQNFGNVQVMPNCKELKVLTEDELVFFEKEPHALCTFSRVSKEKGIEDAVAAVKSVNERLGRTVYTLDIYGQVDAGQDEWFEHLQKEFPEYVRYGGVVPFDKSVEVLKDSFVLLFPTRFYTEGIPGTIIDAYAAGLPVISARWESFADIVEEGVTGFGYKFGSVEELTNRLLFVAENTETVASMKTNCLAYSKRYLPKEAIQVLIRNFS